MAPSRGKGKARAVPRSNGARASGRRATRASHKAEADSGDVYADMLAEAAAVDPPDDLSDRPLKKRRVKARSDVEFAGVAPDTTDNEPHMPVNQSSRIVQTVEESSASEDDDDESDFAFEDVDLNQPSTSGPANDNGGEDGIADVSVAVDSAPKRQIRIQRKPASAAEKAHRLRVHKAHVLGLLVHCIYINSWCNNAVVQRHLRPLLSNKVVNFLNPKASDSQFRQTEAFMDGLQQASDVFRGEFKVSANGMRSANWETEDDDIMSDPVDRSDFITAAKNLEGSQDTGSQLFCALLRSVGVEARLVCSLQTLPFSRSSAKPSTPQKLAKTTVYVMTPGIHSPLTDSNTEDNAVRDSSTIGKVPSARRRLGQPSFPPEPVSSHTTPRPKRSIRKLNYPIFWTEAFNPAHQKWIAIDPLVTQTVNRPSKLEPPSAYSLNQLSYAIALESDCVARDVTRRYARAFNAKTRRNRVESTEGGAQWLRKTLRFFRRKGGALDRDQVEDAELAQREAREGLPTNVQDFKHHPYYALERHLRRHEVIHPRREVGKVNAGTAAKPRMEVVFRRQDVLVCRSADKWYRLGRVIKTGEVGVKRVPTRRMRRARSPSQEGEDAEEEAMTPLYALSQTELYLPPPVVDGRVPRNAFGNLDIYVPSMVPAGGTHVRHPLAKEAARALRIDCVDAVTGFTFKGRQGTAVTDGVVVASEHADGVAAAIESLGDDRVEEESKARSAVALRFWRKFLTGLRIQERVATYGDQNVDRETEDVEMEGEDTGGGFLPSDAADEEALPTAGRFSLVELSAPSKSAKRAKKVAVGSESEDEAELSDEDDEGVGEEGTVVPASSRLTRSTRKVVEDESEDESMFDNGLADSSGGHDVDMDGDGGGGFIPDYKMEENSADGFVPENDGEGGDGGGFLPDEELDNGDEDVWQRPAEHPEDEGENGAGGFIPEGQGTDEANGVLPDTAASMEIAGNTTLQDRIDIAAVDDTSRSRTGPHQHTHLAVGQPTEALCQEMQVSQIPLDVDTTPSATTASQPREHAVNNEDESDRGSMLSHDPDDEDAIPDWLDSD